MTYAETAAHHHYVSVKDHARWGLLLGPYRTRDEAKANVDRARCAAREIDPWAAFYGFGTTRVTTTGKPPQGRLNDSIGLTEPSPGP